MQIPTPRKAPNQGLYNWLENYLPLQITRKELHINLIAIHLLNIGYNVSKYFTLFMIAGLFTNYV